MLISLVIGLCKDNKSIVKPIYADDFIETNYPYFFHIISNLQNFDQIFILPIDFILFKWFLRNYYKFLRGKFTLQTIPKSIFNFLRKSSKHFYSCSAELFDRKVVQYSGRVLFTHLFHLF